MEWKKLLTIANLLKIEPETGLEPTMSALGKRSSFVH